MKPYYEDDSVTLYHGDAAEVLPSLDVEAHVLLTDPPYFQVKDDEWDRQWKQTDDFLGWLGGVLDRALPLLAPSATAWVFAGPALAARVEREVVAPRLRVLNSVRWVKEAGWHQKSDIPAQRRYLTPWEGVILADRADDAYEDADWWARQETFSGVGRHLREAREAVGLTRENVAVALEGQYATQDSAKARLSAWEVGNEYVSRAAHEVMSRLYGAGFRSYESITAEYEGLRERHVEARRSYESLRRPFSLSRRGPVTDVWDFKPVMAYPGKHPCEKPLAMLLHMIETTSRPGDLILDPFAGSGSTADAARACGRRAVLIEQDPRYCNAIANRLAQGDLFGGAA